MSKMGESHEHGVQRKDEFIITESLLYEMLKGLISEKEDKKHEQ